MSSKASPSRALPAALLIAAGLVGSALYVRAQVRRVERQHPPGGQFIEVDGVRLHYIERGSGEQVLVLLHGNGTMALDFELAGLIDAAARTYRVIAFDRPGFGFSERPRDRRWTPEAQARLLLQALHLLDVRRATVLAHSWGTLVAVSMGLQEPQLVQHLVLASGYYYPTPRLDSVLLSGPAWPVIGPLVRHTVSPLAARLIWPGMMRKLFGPSEVPPSFQAFPKWLALRPRQLQAAAAEGAGMIAAAARLRHHYRELSMPVTIVAGTADRHALARLHSERLHAELPSSRLILLRGLGHMLQHLAPEAVLSAALGDEAQEPLASRPPRTAGEPAIAAGGALSHA